MFTDFWQRTGQRSTSDTASSFHGRDEGRDSEADGSFAGEVECVGFRHASVSTAEGSSHRISQNCMEDTQVVRLKTGGMLPLSSQTKLLAGALMYCPCDLLQTTDISLVSVPLNDLSTTAGARGIHSLAARSGTGPR